MKQKTAKVTIRGIKPFLFNAFSEKNLPLSGRQEKKGVTGNNPEEWKDSVLMNDKRQLYIPDNYLFAPIKEGAKYIKEGRGSIQKKVTASLQVIEPQVLIKDRFVPEEDKLTTNSTEKVYLHICSVRNPTTKGRNIRYRIACAPDWEASFTITWDGTLVTASKMNECLIDGGRLAGIGDGRAIGFGRFEVDNFALVEE